MLIPDRIDIHIRNDSSEATERALTKILNLLQTINAKIDALSSSTPEIVAALDQRADKLEALAQPKSEPLT